MSFDGGAVISPTVGGCHPTDLGQLAVADFYSRFLPPILAAAEARGGGGGGSGGSVGRGSSAPAPATDPVHTAPAAPAAAAASPPLPEAVAAAQASDAAHAALLRTTVGSVTAAPPAGAAGKAVGVGGTVWSPVEGKLGLGLTGRAFAADHTAAAAPGTFFHRLPAAAQGVVRNEVWGQQAT